MQPELYQQMREVEDHHWWFAGRRKIVSGWLEQLGLNSDSQLLDLGCGTGGNLEMLSHFGTVTGVEMDARARALAAERNLAPIHPGSLPFDLPFTGETFDCITMLDVLEHVEQDINALKAVRDRLAPSGNLLLTVPAFQFLWGPHDEHHHHFRRYRRADLRSRLSGAGFLVKRVSYFNTWLFPPIALIRLLQSSHDKSSGTGDATMPPTWMNSLLFQLFCSERFALKHASLPFGVSLIAVAQKA